MKRRKEILRQLDKEKSSLMLVSKNHRCESSVFAWLLLLSVIVNVSGCTVDFSMKNVMSTDHETGRDGDANITTDADSDPDGETETSAGVDTDIATDTDANSDGDFDTGIGADTDTSPVVNTDSGPDTVPEVTQCDRKFEDFVGKDQEAIGNWGKCNKQDCAVIDVWDTTPNSNTNVWSYLEVEMWGPKLGSADLAINGDIFNLDNYVIFAAGCVEIMNREVCNKHFLATQGTLTVTDVDPDEPWSGKLTFTITDAKLVEMKANWTAETFSWIKNGETVCVDSWSYSGSVSKGNI